MKHYIFDKSFDQVFTKERLHYELSMLKPAPQEGEAVLESIEKGHFFGEDPKQMFEIPKNDGTNREVVLSSTKTKIIQKVLSHELASVLQFSDRSYAFRKGKSPYKAIMRVRDFLRSESHVAKVDIEKFFDTIDHNILIGKLEKIIRDKRIVHLIGYYLLQGYLKKNRWIDKNEGIYQGDVLSPLLSNIYLNDFDHYLEAQEIKFVRYSDDILLLGQNKNKVSRARKKASEYLSRLHLRFNAKKTYLSDIDKGFEYLGIHFLGNELSIDTLRLAKKINLLKEQTKKLSLDKSVIRLNEMILGFKNYYVKLIDDDSQMQLLQSALDKIMIEKISYAKHTGTHSSKNQIKVALTELQSYVPEHHRQWIERLIVQAYAQLAMKKPLESAQKRVAVEKRNFLQKQIKASELVVSQIGAFIGFSQGKLKVKLKGRIIAEAPIGHIKRILLLNRQSSISTYAIYECAKRKIDIDFIEKSKPYALLTYYHHVSSKLNQTQLKLGFSSRGLAYAKEVAHAKSLNQINLLKYLNRRRQNMEIKRYIGKMEILLKTIKKAKEKKVLMGIEGNISIHYWHVFGTLLGIDGFIRTHKDSIDEINQALNYGYAILYNRVQSALIHEGLNLHYPLYHAMQSNKPTLVFDMVEEFRQPIVDREILAMLNRGQKITQVNGRLSKESIKLIVQHIQERLATPTPSRYGKTPFYNIINFQMNHLKRSMLDESRYKGFVNKY